MSLAAQQSLESHYVMHTFGRSPVEFVEGHGMKLTGDDGREYLDFLAGIGVCSLGHGDPAVLSALEAQTKKLMHVSNYFYIEQRGQVAALLSKLANDDVDGARVRPYARDHCRHHAGLAAGQLPPAAGWLCGLHAQRCG